MTTSNIKSRKKKKQKVYAFRSYLEEVATFVSLPGEKEDDYHMRP